MEVGTVFDIKNGILSENVLRTIKKVVVLLFSAMHCQVKSILVKSNKTSQKEDRILQTVT
jgi:hypothetical protein